MLVVGLTGGIASGKSTVSHHLSSHHHIPIIDADVLAREVISPGTSGYSVVLTHFGPDRILLPDGVNLDRAAIGDIVFHDPEERRWLNGIIHPRVRREMVRKVVRYWLRGEWCVIVDVPLLIEAGMWKWVGEIVVVYVNERLQLSRLLARTSNPPLTQTQATARIASQLPLSTKLKYATSVIDNSGTLVDLTAQIDRVVAKWKVQQGGQTGWWWRICWLLPPVGLAAGGLCLFARWWKGQKGDRRRGRGEVTRQDDSAEERIELTELRGGRRRGTGSSITDGDD
ncbi:dephospho-CoA kinase [Kwoniella shandongensis]|uniref:Dephospho-CoA kinase n=1 Tax=Kwoniella shandongensis TaxID=1734106 RepID=A0A5M6BZZ9_9TREE|nr:dephospho-CoA kinase [Kwoniella shandongensis]KAA5528354.1 dephospho-CoA kinase [Kwoniella shandongensis]